MHELVERTGASEGRRWTIKREPMLLGRSAQCDIRVIDTIVSRRHCEIWESDAGVHFRDLGSSNASLINGEPIHETVLRTGDEISIGGHVFVVASAEVKNDFLDASVDDPTPITVALSESVYALDEVCEVDKPGFTAEDGFRSLLAFSRQLSRIETVTESLECLERLLVDRFKPEALWVVTFRGAEREPLQQRIVGDATSGNIPVDAIHRAAQQTAGFLVPLTHRGGKRSALQTLMVTPLTIGNEAIGAIAAQAGLPHGVFDESDLEFFIAVAHTFAPYFRALGRAAQLKRDYERSDAALDRSSGLIGETPVMRRVRKELRRAAETPLNVLLCGETGTGKELAARMLHDESPRADGPYIVVNCAAIPSNLFESEIFGHEQGAFTGATRRKIGRFEEAHGGTLFLDEIGDLSEENQACLLRAIEVGSFNRVGGPAIIVDVRVVAATNRLSVNASHPQCMRSDLYHRLSGFEIHLPPLRERIKDVGPLAEHFLQQFNRHNGTFIAGIAPEAYQALSEWYWPGNVRELRACIERAASLTQSDTIQLSDILLRDPVARAAEQSGVKLTLAEAEKKHILAVLQHNQGNIRATARALDISRTTLYKKFEDYGITS